MDTVRSWVCETLTGALGGLGVEIPRLIDVPLTALPLVDCPSTIPIVITPPADVVVVSDIISDAVSLKTVALTAAPALGSTSDVRPVEPVAYAPNSPVVDTSPPASRLPV